MPSDFSALNIPELAVNPKAVFSGDLDSYEKLVLLSEFDIEKSPFYRGLEPKDAGSETGDKDESRKKMATALKAVGRYLLKAYETEIFTDDKNKKKRWSHAEQRRVLEQAIRLFEKAGNGEDEQAVPLETGKAYLYRSRIIRPKGFTVPAKKKKFLEDALEALENALEALEDALEALGFCEELKEKKAEAAHYVGLVVLEMERCDLISDERLKDLLKSATEEEKNTLDKPQWKPEFYQMRVRLEEIEKGDWKNLKPRKNFSKMAELEQLKTSIYYPGDIDEVLNPKPKKQTKKGKKAKKKQRAVNKGKTRKDSGKRLLSFLSKRPFSHPIWENTVRFLSRIYRICNEKEGEIKNYSPDVIRRMKDFWPDFAIDLWKTAENISQLTSALHLRWYWSRQRDLYDIAFLAAIGKEDYKKAAEIADSSKNRPPMTWQTLESLGGKDEELKISIEQYACALGGGYISGFVNIVPKVSSDDKNDDFPEKTDGNTVIVQFYLVHLKGFEKGYAVVCNENGWQTVHDFVFKPIWEAYLKWQTVYFDLPSRERDQSAPQLRYLCNEMGKELGFLFDLAADDKKKELLIVPHDFLHRVPMHGAVTKDEDDDEFMLLEKFKCVYLTSINAPHEDNTDENKVTASKPVLLQYLDDSKSNDARRVLFDDWPGNFFDELNSTRQADYHSVEKLSENLPPLLVLYCHGKADVVNPFYSKLLLKDNVSLLKLSFLKKKFTGMKILFSACESDLVPPLDSPLDEHISAATIFMNKGVCEVMGTMWEADAEIIKENILSAYTEKKGFDVLFDIHQNKGADFLENEKMLYNFLCFKIYRHHWQSI